MTELSPKERQALAHFYDTEAYKALMKLIELEKLAYAQQHVGIQEIGQVRYLTGKVGALNELIITLKAIYKKTEKS